MSEPERARGKDGADFMLNPLDGPFPEPGDDLELEKAKGAEARQLRELCAQCRIGMMHPSQKRRQGDWLWRWTGKQPYTCDHCGFRVYRR